MAVNDRKARQRMVQFRSRRSMIDIKAPSAPELRLVQATEKDLEVSFKPIQHANNVDYELQWKLPHQSWNDSDIETKALKLLPGIATKEVALSGLLPGSIYHMRLVSSLGESVGEPSKDLLVETKPMGECCSIL